MAQVLTPSSPRHLSARRSRLAIPFVNTSFGTDVQIYLILWPLWWVLGVEQLLSPFFLAWETVRHLLYTGGRFSINAPIRWAFLLALWWLVPVGWVEREHLDIFLKEAATAWSQVLVLFLFWNGLRTARDWWRVVRGLKILAAYIALGGLVFVLGLWRGEVLSLVGRALPAPLIKSSAFFSSISFRTFGTISARGSLLFQRVSSFALQFSGLSMVCLLLIPFTAWRLSKVKGVACYGQAIVLVGLLLCLVYAESRIAYLAFAVGLAVFVALKFGLFRSPNRSLLLALVALAVALVVGAAHLAFSEIAQALRTAILEWRPGSWLVRFRIYQETLRLLPEHLIAGWGIPVRIRGMLSVYSAGTHSSYLGMLFQHGVIGLALYLGLWLSIWRKIVKGLRARAIPRSFRLFWGMATASMLSFNIREVADTWWWDQLVTMTIWTIWGLILTAPRFFSRWRWSQCVSAREAFSNCSGFPGRENSTFL